MPWLGMELATLWFTGPCSIHWATPARAVANFIVLFIQDCSYSFFYLPFYCRKIKKNKKLLSHNALPKVVIWHCSGQWGASKSLQHILEQVFVFLIQMWLHPSPFLLCFPPPHTSSHSNGITDASAAILYPWGKIKVADTSTRHPWDTDHMLGTGNIHTFC